MRMLFTAWGASVATGANAAAVLAASRTGDATGAGSAQRPDLIVADLRLAQGECGLAAVAELRMQTGCRVPALIVSGDTGEDARAAVTAAGFALLAKPVVAATLHAAAATALATAVKGAQRAA
jgi:CheY-like chemotaxis protein